MLTNRGGIETDDIHHRDINPSSAFPQIRISIYCPIAVHISRKIEEGVIDAIE
ncbi:MAG: hypothetical protein QNJ55_14425 [Xenococcus sp. MO_188.B8]|nr:hypothetical protein [Xenococcus sp. MO_188.B8]